MKIKRLAFFIAIFLAPLNFAQADLIADTIKSFDKKYTLKACEVPEMAAYYSCKNKVPKSTNQMLKLLNKNACQNILMGMIKQSCFK